MQRDVYETIDDDGVATEHESLAAARTTSRSSGEQVRTRSVDVTVPAVYEIRVEDSVIGEFSSVPAAMAFAKSHPGSTIHLVAKA